mgnify:FL=1
MIHNSIGVSLEGISPRPYFMVVRAKVLVRTFRTAACLA